MDDCRLPKDTLQNFSWQTLTHIFNHLTPDEVLAASQVNKTWYRAAQELEVQRAPLNIDKAISTLVAQLAPSRYPVQIKWLQAFPSRQVNGSLPGKNQEEIAEFFKPLRKERLSDIYRSLQSASSYLSPVVHSLKLQDLLRLDDTIKQIANNHLLKRDFDFSLLATMAQEAQNEERFSKDSLLAGFSQQLLSSGYCNAALQLSKGIFSTGIKNELLEKMISVFTSQGDLLLALKAAHLYSGRLQKGNFYSLIYRKLWQSGQSQLAIELLATFDPQWRQSVIEKSILPLLLTDDTSVELIIDRLRGACSENVEILIEKKIVPYLLALENPLLALQYAVQVKDPQVMQEIAATFADCWYKGESPYPSEEELNSFSGCELMPAILRKFKDKKNQDEDYLANIQQFIDQRQFILAMETAFNLVKPALRHSAINELLPQFLSEEESVWSKSICYGLKKDLFFEEDIDEIHNFSLKNRLLEGALSRLMPWHVEKSFELILNLIDRLESEQNQDEKLLSLIEFFKEKGDLDVVKELIDCLNDPLLQAQLLATMKKEG